MDENDGEDYTQDWTETTTTETRLLVPKHLHRNNQNLGAVTLAPEGWLLHKQSLKHEE